MWVGGESVAGLLAITYYQQPRHLEAAVVSTADMPESTSSVLFGWQVGAPTAGLPSICKSVACDSVAVQFRGSSVAVAVF
jgi:hypothetical protein